MKNAERFIRTLHVGASLTGSLRSSAAVTDALAALDKATSAVRAADGDELAKEEANRVASARVRDATGKCFDECRRARGAIVAKDASFDAPFTREMRGRSPRALLAKGYFLLQHGTQKGVGLPDLAAAVSAVSLVEGAATTAREERRAAVRARRVTEEAWDAAYAALRGAVELLVGTSGLRGQKLLDAVQVFFPPQVDKKPQDVAAADPSGGKPAAPEKKPAA